MMRQYQKRLFESRREIKSEYRGGSCPGRYLAFEMHLASGQA